MFAYPSGELFDSPLTGFYRQYHLDYFQCRGDNLESVALEKVVGQVRGGAFVAANPRVVLNQAKTQGRRLRGQVNRIVSGGLSRTR